MTISNLKQLHKCLMRDSSKYTGRNYLRSYLVDVRFKAIVCLRLMQLSYHHPLIPKVFASFLRNRLILKYGLDTRPDVTIGEGFRIVHLGAIVIHGDATIGRNFTCLNCITVGQRSRNNLAVPTIGHNVFIGAYTMILGGVKISDNTKIDAQMLIENDL